MHPPISIVIVQAVTIDMRPTGKVKLFVHPAVFVGNKDGEDCGWYKDNRKFLRVVVACDDCISEGMMPMMSSRDGGTMWMRYHRKSGRSFVRLVEVEKAFGWMFRVV